MSNEDVYTPDLDRFGALVNREPEEDYSIEDRQLDEIAQVFHALDKPEKIIVFHEAARQNSLTQVEDAVNVSNSTIYNYVDDFVDAGMIERKTESGKKYQATEFGDYVYKMLCQLDVMIALRMQERITGDSIKDNDLYQQINDFRYVYSSLTDEFEQKEE